MVTKTSTRVSIDLIPDVHQELQFLAHASGTTIGKYVTDTLMDRIQEEIKKGRLWAKMSEEARKEGFLSVEESEKLIQRIKNA